MPLHPQKSLACSMTPASPTLASMLASKKKKRCWALLFKDIASEVEEADMFSFFRKRYTSVTRLAFRPPAAGVADGAGRPSPATTAAAIAAGAPTAGTTKKARFPSITRPNASAGSNAETKTTKGGSMCVEIQFTGPQPIDGPAGLMRNLLQATLVEASPVHLDRGRKRKVRHVRHSPGCPAALPAASSRASSRAGTSATGTDL
ncbi:unnamed protein product, partial [Scytosiphon promiscuus]